MKRIAVLLVVFLVTSSASSWAYVANKKKVSQVHVNNAGDEVLLYFQTTDKHKQPGCGKWHRMRGSTEAELTLAYGLLVSAYMSGKRISFGGTDACDGGYTDVFWVTLSEIGHSPN